MPFSDGRIRPLSRNAEMIRYFGAPCDSSELTTVKLPIIGKAYLHQRVAQAFVNVFQSILDAGMAGLIDRDSYGGTYCCRTVRGSSAKSPHSWAVAIDLNTDHIMRGGEEVQGTSNFRCSEAQVPDSLKKLEPFFTAWGFSWGGFWRSYKDPMHFEATEYTVDLLEDRQIGNVEVRRYIEATRFTLQHKAVAAPHEPPLLVRDGKTICKGRMIDGKLWTPTRMTLQAAGSDVSWHPEQGKGYIIDAK